MKDELRKRVLAAKAADLMYDRANKVDNVLGSGTASTKCRAISAWPGSRARWMPQGNTNGRHAGADPRPAELKAALIKAAFDAQKGDPPRLIEVPTPSTGGSAYYALSVEDVDSAGGEAVRCRSRSR